MDNLETLRAIDEWGALGWYEGQGLPWPRAYGLAYRRLYEHMPVDIPEDRYLIPHEPFYHARTRASHGYWSAVGYICDFHHHFGLRATPEIAEEKKARFPQYADAIDALVNDLLPRFEQPGGYTHSNPDIRRVVHDGFLAMVVELDAELEAAQRAHDDAAVNLLLALKDYTNGVHAYHAHVSEALRLAATSAVGERKEQLTLIADSFTHSFLYPARTFLEGLLAVNFTWMLDGCDSIGRFDQALNPLFAQDLANGTLDLEFARALLDELWNNFDRLNAWNLQIGGYTPDGRDGTNTLTLECIAACARNKCLRPNVAFRITSHTPDEALIAALKALGEGSGRPPLYNDELYVQTLSAMDLGLTTEDAREIGFGGCTETMIAGMSNVGSLEGFLNLAKALELALNDGFDPVKGVQEGPHTGCFTDFPDFASFQQAVQRQITYMTDAFVAENRSALRQRFTSGDPKLYRTFFTRDCVKNHKSFEAGGARYNWAVVSYQGIANLIDGLAAIRQCVFESGEVSPALLMAALAADYSGFEDVRQRLLAAPKFGNDDPTVDDPGSEIIRFAWECLYAHETPRGGRYLPSCILFETYLSAGKDVGATPDGRKAFTVLTDSVGPAQGRDTHGPTALLNSLVKLPLSLAAGTPVLNLRFQKKIMHSATGLRAIADLVRAFFASGGMQVQISVISKEEMLDAQQHPEDHRDLIVRIGGYSAYFTALDHALQDSIIMRTEYTV
jgi:formate C-acetyltransferase